MAKATVLLVCLLFWNTALAADPERPERQSRSELPSALDVSEAWMDWSDQVRDRLAMENDLADRSDSGTLGSDGLDSPIVIDYLAFRGAVSESLAQQGYILPTFDLDDPVDPEFGLIPQSSAAACAAAIGAADAAIALYITVCYRRSNAVACGAASAAALSAMATAVVICQMWFNQMQ